jgi:hypothetical protein
MIVVIVTVIVTQAQDTASSTSKKREHADRNAYIQYIQVNPRHDPRAS